MSVRVAVHDTEPLQPGAANTDAAMASGIGGQADRHGYLLGIRIAAGRILQIENDVQQLSIRVIPQIQAHDCSPRVMIEATKLPAAITKLAPAIAANTIA